jgi:hypothetical protein
MNITTNLIIGVSLILIGAVIERWLVRIGAVRDKTYSLVVIAILSVLMKQFWYNTISWWFYAPFTLLAMVFGANRGDLSTTMSQGSWWWKK